MKIAWRNETRKIDDLKPASYNPRKFTEKQLADLTVSLDKFALADPIIINANNAVIGGHLRLRALKAKGIAEVEVRIPDRELSEMEEKELNIRLNRNTGEFDFDLLANFDESLLKDIGFDSSELDEIFKEPITEDDVPSIPQVAESKRGEIYLLGPHRLMCGDSTSREDVEKLMGGKKADMVFTDPPYGINVVKGSKVGGGKNLGFGKVGVHGFVKANLYRPIIGDDKEFDPSFLLDYGEHHIIFGGNYFANKLPASRCWIVWDKQIIGTTFADVEIAWTDFDKPSKLYSFVWAGLRREGDRESELKSRIHPTQKPVGLFVNIFKDFPGVSILDLFGGSGSTLIACEQTQRICYMMEIDENYCDVIRTRYGNFKLSG